MNTFWTLVILALVIALALVMLVAFFLWLFRRQSSTATSTIDSGEVLEDDDPYGELAAHRFFTHTGARHGGPAPKK